MTEFTLGQRWISNTEPELGLGIVSDVDHRLITISFPAADEHRAYARNNAPLARVKYRLGDRVQDLDGNSMVIRAIAENDHYITYSGENSQGDSCSLGEVELDCFVNFNKPLERLFAGQIDKLSDYRLRQQTLVQQQKLASAHITGLIGPRVQLLPHQLYIASEVGQRFAPRVLLADEVGLGKTIEAGLIIHQQLLRGLSQRVLIAVPDSLVHQWLVEMLRRFNLAFTLLDEERCDAIENPESLDEEELVLEEFSSDNPFDSAQLVLCSISLLSDNPKRLEQALECRWDLMVVDEAHHLHWHPDMQCDAYSAVEQLAALARGLLLLTATPEQVGVDSHFARLRLLDPDRYFDLERFREEQTHFGDINDWIEQLHSGQTVDNGLSQQLQALLGDDVVPLLASESGRQTITEQLLDRYGTGRVLFRNTRAAVAGFPERRLHSHALAADEEELQAKLQWLVDWLKQHRQEKVLVICSRAHAAQELELQLRLRHGVRSAVFVESLSLIERDRAAAYFADQEDGAQVLICSEIGSEGRNFQFAHHLVMLDLPLNPDLIEQRIGRLDRIGQTETVHIHVPVQSGSAEESLLHWYHEGLNGFEQVCPIGQAVYEEFADELDAALRDAAGLPALIAATKARSDELRDALRHGRDRLLELNSCKPAVAAQLVEALASLDEDPDLSAYMELAFDCYGVDSERHSEHSFVAHPSDHMHSQHFPGLPDEGITATYSRQQALSREDMHFLTWEHPMVSGVMDMVLNSERGNTTVCTMKLPPLKPGSLLVEALFSVHHSAPRFLQLQRFLDNSYLRLVTDNQLRALQNVVKDEHFRKLEQRLKGATAKQLVEHARNEIERIASHLEKQAEAERQQLIDTARDNINRYYEGELSRLRALADVNPNIRGDEIAFLEELQQVSLTSLEHAQIQLHAIKVALITN